MRTSAAFLVIGLILAAGPGCGDDGGGGPGVSFEDARGLDLAPDEGEGDDVADPGDAEEDADAALPDAAPDAVDPGPDVPDAVDGGPDVADVGPDSVDAGPDVPDAGPDTVDAGPDTVTPGGDLPIDPAVIIGLCGTLCQDMDEECGAGAIGGSVAACRDMCIADTTEDGWLLATWTCYADECAPAACSLGGPAPEEEPLCGQLCAALDGCDMLALADLPEDEPNACRAACTGSVLADPETTVAIPCMLDALDPACDAVAVQACFGDVQPPESACPLYCAPFYDPSREEFCEEATPLRQAWPGEGDCTATCEGADSGAEALRFFGCTLGLTCGDPAPCLALPEADDPSCEDACDAMFDLCGQMGGLPTAEACAAWCTGLMVNFGGGADDKADSCIDDLGTCPATADEQGSEFIRCSVPRSAACETICQEVAGCPGEGGEPIDETECGFACATGALGPAETLGTVADCMDAAPDDCSSKFMCFQDEE